MPEGMKVRRVKSDAVAEELKSLQKGSSSQEKPKINLGDAAALKRVLDDAAISVRSLSSCLLYHANRTIPVGFRLSQRFSKGTQQRLRCCIITYSDLQVLQENGFVEDFTMSNIRIGSGLFTWVSRLQP